MPLRIFPNPASSGQITISGNGHGYNYVTVMDMQGRRVFASAWDGSKDCRIQLPVAGIYLLRCESASDNPAVVQRVIMQ